MHFYFQMNDYFLVHATIAVWMDAADLWIYFK